MRDSIGTTVVLFVLFFIPTASFLGIEAFYIALVGALLPQILRLVRSWSSSRESSDGSETASRWDSVPTEQYTGRFAEAGGISRKEQEQALNDVQGQAQVEKQRNPSNRKSSDER